MGDRLHLAVAAGMASLPNDEQVQAEGFQTACDEESSSKSDISEMSDEEVRFVLQHFQKKGMCQSKAPPSASSGVAATVCTPRPPAPWSKAAQNRARKRASSRWKHIHEHEMQKDAEKKRRRDARRMYEAMGITDVPEDFQRRLPTPSKQEKVMPKRRPRRKPPTPPCPPQRSPPPQADAVTEAQSAQQMPQISLPAPHFPPLMPQFPLMPLQMPTVLSACLLVGPHVGMQVQPQRPMEGLCQLQPSQLLQQPPTQGASMSRLVQMSEEELNDLLLNACPAQPVARPPGVPPLPPWRQPRRDL